LRLAADSLVRFSGALRTLRDGGLPLHAALVLHRTFTDGAVTHLLRAGVATVEECQEWDVAVAQFWEGELGVTFSAAQRAQRFLPLDSGGFGFQSASWRRPAALLGSWELCLRAVALAAGFPSAASLRDSCSQIARSIAEAESCLAGAGVQYAFDWAARFGEARGKQQGEIAAELHEAVLGSLRASLPEDARVDLDSAGGGGGLFLLAPMHSRHWMCDEHLSTALRRRLLFPHPAHDPACILGPSSHCKHRRANGTFCDEALDARGHHAGYCSCGGGSVHGHDAIVRWLAAWLREWSGHPVATEQYVPQWDRLGADGEVSERARLDVAFVDSEGRRAYADVAVTSAYSADPAVVSRRAREPGTAAKDMVGRKRDRYKPEAYPAAGLVPFVVESLGRISPEARALIRSVAPHDPSVRSSVIRAALQDLSVLVQTRLAEQLLSAEAGRKRGT